MWQPNPFLRNDEANAMPIGWAEQNVEDPMDNFERRSSPSQTVEDKKPLSLLDGIRSLFQ